ncbi:type VII secretion system-associated protein [Amycolatopsis thailandensis]|uniref:type VII secretion system-associated protein n=1 Tax=Amycolatopsis thailandensis TaxID=589330 RepID=UPI00363510A6
MSETAADESVESRLMFLLDPAFESEEGQDTPVDAIIGGWLIDGNGTRGRFQPNPEFRPRSAESPLDPVDALLRQLLGGADIADEFVAALSDAVLGVAVDEEGSALIRSSPDGVPCLVVATAFGHRGALGEHGRWLDVSVEDLAAALPAEGVDVLLNPDSTASMRVLAETVRTAAEFVEEEPQPASAD